MAKVKIFLRCEDSQRCPRKFRRRITDAAKAVLDAEGIEEECELSVLITDDTGIRLINLEHRQVDRPTDVLSFPMGDTDPVTGRYVLGDMVLDLERARAQGKELGHGEDREISYLTVHSVLHLLGYDHEDEGEMKRQMRAREKVIMKTLGLGEDEIETEP